MSAAPSSDIFSPGLYNFGAVGYAGSYTCDYACMSRTCAYARFNNHRRRMSRPTTFRAPAIVSDSVTARKYLSRSREIPATRLVTSTVGQQMFPRTNRNVKTRRKKTTKYGVTVIGFFPARTATTKGFQVQPPGIRDIFATLSTFPRRATRTIGYL